MQYGVTLRFNVDLDVEDVNVANDLLSELPCDQILAMADGAINMDVEVY